MHHRGVSACALCMSSWIEHRKSQCTQCAPYPRDSQGPLPSRPALPLGTCNGPPRPQGAHAARRRQRLLHAVQALQLAPGVVQAHGRAVPDARSLHVGNVLAGLRVQHAAKAKAASYTSLLRWAESS